MERICRLSGGQPLLPCQSGQALILAPHPAAAQPGGRKQVGSHIADPTPIRCSTLYLDKPMRIHTLMQTLA